jgi:hypothetical protein
LPGRWSVHQLLMRVTGIGAICSLLASAAGLGLALWPCAYQGVEAAGGDTPERQFCESLVEANGVSVLALLALPVLLAGVGLAAVRWCWRPILVAVMVALVAFCVLAVASVGLFYLPAAAAVVIAVVGWRHMPTTPPAADGPRPPTVRGISRGLGRDRCQPSVLVR